MNRTQYIRGVVLSRPSAAVKWVEVGHNFWNYDRGNIAGKVYRINSTIPIWRCEANIFFGSLANSERQYSSIYLFEEFSADKGKERVEAWLNEFLAGVVE